MSLLKSLYEMVLVTLPDFVHLFNFSCLLIGAQD